MGGVVIEFFFWFGVFPFCVTSLTISIAGILGWIIKGGDDDQETD